MSKEIARVLKDYIKSLKKKKIKSYSEIPEEYHNEYEIIAITRKLGLRKTTKCGYDIITKLFFAEEIIVVSNYAQELSEKKIVNTFTDFQAYFEFLQGDIYENSCYFQYTFTTDLVNQFQLDVDRLNMHSNLSCTIDDLLPDASADEKEEFDVIERQMPLRKKWIKKYNACSTYKELLSVNRKHGDSKDCTDEEFYIWNYINHHGEKAFDVIMQFVCTGQYPAYRFEKALCFLFGAERVLKAYNYTGGVASTNKKHNSQFKRTVEEIANTKVTSKTAKYFDKYTHYYCVKTSIYLGTDFNHRPVAELYRYFETFAEFTEFLGNDLSDCDLSKAHTLCEDFSVFMTSSTTKLPINALSNLKKVISKRYNRIKSRFEVIVKWYTAKEIEVFEKKIAFNYFIDFVAFLNNDLSDADLLFCDGLQNITDFSDFNLENVRIQSSLAKRLGLRCEESKLLQDEIEEFATARSNETETSIILKTDRAELSTFENSTDERKIYYITDLHLMHRIQHAHCITKDDCVYVVQRIIDTLLEDKPFGSLILIGGDIASGFWVYQLFVNLLRKTIDELRLYVKVVFILGNHELWGFQGHPINSIVEEYRCLLTDNNMHLIQNEILYLDEASNILCIPQQELKELTDKEIRERLRTARVIIFGGIGFSGYNQEFNANNGIYRSTLSREDEVSESVKFENLYDRICACLSDKNIVIFTHMPFTDWHKEGCRQNDFVYVSGHNHKNDFYDDDVVRIYADNQVGYHTEQPKLKYFYIDNMYDWFSDYEDGIHTITRDDYINFYRGKNLPLTFNRDINKLCMLKKNDYYCFIHENLSGSLTMLNGGSLKSLNSKDIQWYYDNMDAEIAYIKAPLDKFQSIQLQISNTVKDIGGSGYIHGAIVDIDFYNHIYVNPFDLTITPYFAWDIIEKYIYPNVPALLKSNCPLLYANYNKLLTGGQTNALIPKDEAAGLIVKPELYLSTDIYAASRELKKMQKLNSNILSTWYDNVPGIKMLPSRKVVHSAIGESKMMKCGMTATIIAYVNYNDISVKFEDGTIVEHIRKDRFTNGTIKNPNMPTEKSISSAQIVYAKKDSYVGKTNVMNCGLKATVIEDFGCKDITVQFEDGLIRKHRRRDHFDLGKIAHVPDKSE